VQDKIRRTDSTLKRCGPAIRRNARRYVSCRPKSGR
jgi:hypothetical protein